MLNEHHKLFLFLHIVVSCKSLGITSEFACLLYSTYLPSACIPHHSDSEVRYLLFVADRFITQFTNFILVLIDLCSIFLCYVCCLRLIIRSLFILLLRIYQLSWFIVVLYSYVIFTSIKYTQYLALNLLNFCIYNVITTFPYRFLVIVKPEESCFCLPAIFHNLQCFAELLCWACYSSSPAYSLSLIIMYGNNYLSTQVSWLRLYVHYGGIEKITQVLRHKSFILLKGYKSNCLSCCYFHCKGIVYIEYNRFAYFLEVRIISVFLLATCYISLPIYLFLLYCYDDLLYLSVISASVINIYLYNNFIFKVKSPRLYILYFCYILTLIIKNG